jgi:AcrR family transcriptional regulator
VAKQANREDHRVRVAAERRERMQARLSEAALLVIGERGVDGSVIDEIARVAGVARGTFYNYFRGNEDLLAAVATEAGDEMMRAVDPVAISDTDPAVRVSNGIRLWLLLCRRYPHLAAFLRRAGSYALTHSSLVRDFLPRDIGAGIRSGRFHVDDERLAFDLVVGPVLSAINTMLTDEVAADYPDRLAAGVLLALGIDAAEAGVIATRPLGDPGLPSESLIERSGALQETLHQ